MKRRMSKWASIMVYVLELFFSSKLYCSIIKDNLNRFSGERLKMSILWIRIHILLYVFSENTHNFFLPPPPIFPVLLYHWELLFLSITAHVVWNVKAWLIDKDTVTCRKVARMSSINILPCPSPCTDAASK